MITSPHNPKLKDIRRLHRDRRARDLAGRFVAEGEDLLAAADAAGWEPLERYAAAGSGLPGVEVAPEVLAGVSALGSGTRTMAVYGEHWTTALAGPLCVHLHGIHDPGNVGTVLRSAAAFGATGVGIGPETADPFSPKAVRASMGALFAVPVARIPAPPAGLPGATVALVARAGLPLRELVPTLDPDRPVSVLVGSERHGLPEALVAAAEHVAHVPIATESLNAAMAVTVALYELAHRIQRP